MRKIIVIGAGGHAKVLLEILKQDSNCEVTGLLDRNKDLLGKKLLDVPVLGDDSLLEELLEKGTHYALIGVGTTGATRVRKDLYDAAAKAGFKFLSVIHPQAIVSSSAEIGDGTAVIAGAVINAGARIGKNVIVNTRSVIEHDCVIGDHTHIATGALLAGGVTVKEGAHVGIGACVRQGINIGKNAIVGAGAVVVDDVAENTVVAGNPARPLKASTP